VQPSETLHLSGCTQLKSIGVFSLLQAVAGAPHPHRQIQVHDLSALESIDASV